MDLRNSFFSAGHSKIVVCPVGKIPPRLYSDYCHLITSTKWVHLTSLSTGENGAFMFHPGAKARMYFNFVDHETEAKRNRTWNELQTFREVHGLICICHCPSSPDLEEVFTKFLSIQKKYPSIFQFRCFAFEPLASQEDLLERENLVMIPHCEEGREERVEFYVRTCMEDFALMLVEKYAAKVTTLQTFPLLLPST
eukprot:22296_1